MRLGLNGGLAAAIVTAMSAAGAQAAPTTPAECVVANTPHQVRAALLARAPSLRLNEVMSERQSIAVAEACQLPMVGMSAQFIADALRAKTMMVWSSRRLKAEQGVTEEALLARLKKLAPSTFEEFSNAFGAQFNPSAAANDDVAAMARGLGVEGEQADRLVFDYVAGHAVWRRLKHIGSAAPRE